MSRCLVLNADMLPLNIQPLSAIPWKDAVCLVYQEKATVLFEHDDVIHSQYLTWKKPSVIVLRKYVYLERHAKYSKVNVKLRDNFKCGFCLKTFSQNSLTIDHIKPSSKGGQSEWMNVVAACKPCNHSKGDKDIKPIIKPYVPTYYQLARNYFKHMSIGHNEWLQFIPKSIRGEK